PGSDAGPGVITSTPTIQLGAGSDLRFADFTVLASVTPRVINYGQSFTYTDDAGATYTISISGGQTNNGAPLGTTSSATIYGLLISGSRGVVLGRINVNLVAGAQLTVPGNTAGVVTLGTLVVATTPAAGGTTPLPAIAKPAVIFNGPAQIDVYQILAGA